MLKKCVALIAMILGASCFEDISHPHRSTSMLKNLRSFEFPDASQHDKTCSKKRKCIEVNEWYWITVDTYCLLFKNDSQIVKISESRSPAGRILFLVFGSLHLLFSFRLKFNFFYFPKLLLFGVEILVKFWQELSILHDDCGLLFAIGKPRRRRR